MERTVIVCSRIGCPIELRAKAIYDTISEDQRLRGFTFRAEMEFAETCKMCTRLRQWTRLEDGSTRIIERDANAA